MLTNEQYANELNNLVNLANEQSAHFRPFIGYYDVCARSFMERHSYSAAYPCDRDGRDVRILRAFFAHFRNIAACRGVSKAEFNGLVAKLVAATDKQAFDWAKAAANVCEYAQNRKFPRNTACEQRHTDAFKAVLGGKAAA